MKEIFISHSSKDKKFAEILRNEIGHDQCIIDCADFEPGKKSMDEITKWFNECKIFLLLLSENSLGSEWVNSEIELAYHRHYSPQGRNFIFLPIIISDSINYNDARIPEWIREDESFNLKYFRSPVIASHIALKSLRELSWKLNHAIYLRENLFVGRKNELSDFELKFNSTTNRKFNATIISGKTAVGKKSFARQCIISELKESEGFEPYKLTIREKDNIENFILQLNDFVQLTRQEIEEVLSSSKELKIKLAVKLANEIYLHKGYIFVTDKMGCISYNGHLSEWFSDFITHPSLRKELRIFILSEVQWWVTDAKKFPNIISINLHALTLQDRIVLFNKCCDIYNVTGISEEDTKKVCNKLNHSPSQIMRYVRNLKERPFHKDRILSEMLTEADSQTKILLDNFLKDQLSIDLLIVLSQQEFLSHRLLNKIFYDRKYEMNTTIAEMIDFNIIEPFGFGESYLRLDSAVADYMQRSRFKLTEGMSDLVDSILTEMLQDNDGIDDISSYLHKQRTDLENQINSSDRLQIIIPSVAIKFIIDLYYSDKYKEVVELCDRMLKDMHNTYSNAVREIIYWQSMAYARLGDQNKMIESIQGLSDFDKWFIFGFYHRRSGNYEKALEFLEKARNSYADTNKVRRELVEVYLKMGDIDNAIELAEINYNNRPDNVFHIQAYFECLNSKKVRTQEDIKIQERLLKQMHESNAKRASSMYDSMLNQFK